MTGESENISIYHPKTILLLILLTYTTVTSYRVYKKFLVRIPTSLEIPPKYFRNRFYKGRVTSVGDGDNFHLYHTPGGTLGGWGWLRLIPQDRKQLRGNTWSVRLCGVDAPERSHFGKPSQPFSEESLIWLRSYLLNKNVFVKPLKIDQYNRVVAKVLIKKYWLLTKDVSEEMIRNGIGVVYEGKSSAEFDGQEALYRKCEVIAKRKKLGLWGLKEPLITPGEYKKMYK